ncbi:MAG TPA: hypothetical protein VH743_02040 [Beijerinckiaceae bacterium]|jgi:hypothetical protein
MRFGVMAAGLCAATILAGCNTTEVARFKPAANQQAMIRDGRPAIVSKKKNSIVLVSPASRQLRSGGRPVFIVGITNMGKQPTDFLVQNVSVHQTQDGQAVAALPVKTYEQLVSEEKARQVAAAILVGVAAAGNAYSASQAGYGTAHSTVYSGGRMATVSTSYYSPTANAIAQANAAAQNDAMITSAVENGRRNLANLEGSVIKDNTLLPGEWYGGQLHFEAPQQASSGEAKTYVISIPVGSEIHNIEVVQEAVQS